MTDKATRSALATEVHAYDDFMSASEKVLCRPRVIIRDREGYERRETSGDLFVNRNFRRIPLQPAIVFLHGGCWRFGSPSQFYYQATKLSETYNFVCLIVDYTLSKEDIFPQALIDAKCGIQWLRSNKDTYNIDENRIAVCGGSAGANLASLVATTSDDTAYLPEGYQGISSKSNAAVLLNGEYDMIDLIEKSSLIQAMQDYLGGSFSEKPELYYEISSVRHIDHNSCPTLLMHGDKDACVSHTQSVNYYNKLIACSVYAELEIYENKPHAWFNQEPDRSITLGRMEKFLRHVFNL